MSWLTQKTGIITYYNPKIHQGTQPIRVLNPMLVFMFMNTHESFSKELMALIEEGGLNPNFHFHYEKAPVQRSDGKHNTPRVDESKTLELHESFLSYLWSITYATYVYYIETIDFPKCNAVAGWEKYPIRNDLTDQAKELFDYARASIVYFQEWDIEGLPNPEKYPAEDRDFVEQSNGIYTEAVKFILCHEFVHIKQHIDKIGKEINEESHYLAMEEEADREAIEMILMGMTAINHWARELGVVIAILSMFYFRNITTGVKHPNVEDRLTFALTRLGIPEDHPAWGMACVGLKFWDEQFNFQFDWTKGSPSYKQLYFSIVEQVKARQKKDGK